MNENTKTSSDYWRYGIIGLLIVAARGLEAALNGSPWRARLYDSRMWLVVTVVVAILACTCITQLLRKHYSPGVTILLSGLTGAICTLVVSSIPGMVVGLVLGVVVTFDVLRRLARVGLRMLMVYGLPAASIGLLTGYLGSKTLLFAVDPPYSSTLAFILLFLGGVGVVWSLLVARWFGQRWRAILLGTAGFFLVAVVTEPMGIMVERHQRTQSLHPSIYLYGSGVYSLGPELLLRGWRLKTEVSLDQGLSEAQANRLSAFRNIRRLWMSSYSDGGKFDASGFRLLKLDGVTEAYCRRSGFDDDALLAFADSAGMLTLHLPETKVTDAGLTVLASMPSLRVLDVRGTRVDGSGLAHLHPLAPLSVLLLSDTNVGDAALRHIGGCQINHLELRNTSVRGEGFAQLDTSFLQRLDLAGASFQEQHICHFASSPLQTLDLRGTHLTAAGMEQLSKIKTLQELSIHGSHVTDAAMAWLTSFKLTKIQVDASELTLQVAKVLAPIASVELSYDATAMRLEEIIAQYEPLEQQILQLKRAAYIPRPAKGEPVSLAVYGLVVDRGTAQRLEKLTSCLLYETRIADSDEEAQGVLEPDDLDRFFPVQHTASP